MKYLLLFLISIGTLASIPKNQDAVVPIVLEKQKAAFEILSKKCNVCHRSKNQSKVFILENMNRFARRINRQVFVWKRMPKGNEITLSDKEKKTLKIWINSLKK